MAKSIQLTHGNGSMPTVGLGSFTMFGKEGDAADMEQAVCVAIDAGYRHIDTAWLYGTHEAIGKGLAQKTKEGVVKREDMFITTKLWLTHHNPTLVKGELLDSLKDLQTDYVDMLLMHWPMPLEDQDYKWEPFAATGKDGLCIPSYHKLEDVWKAMEDCQMEGLAKNIGISNFNSKQVKQLLKSCTIKPATIQVEVTPYFSNSRLIDLCMSLGIVVTAYSPFGAPYRPWAEDEPSPWHDEVLKTIAQRKGKTIAQVILRFHIQHGLAVIPKSVKPSRIQENIKVFDFMLSDDEMESISALNQNIRAFKNPLCDCSNHPQYPFNEPF